ncbi:hypothetical protein [Flavobacterium sp. GT3R68]|uniref:hypothetical protein n=1 Tax=Flavobacterium sp. GT3R68 TaxID=2594437 RepID=UPI000F89B884|nr:hypothetical protein [Flavobacterium sp. GT3R68]RTY85828.1 hypothetical protein EKL32_28315 [Flavobacterium sp. GSN2]TRW89347.1 hypothetical protein FNW07_13480 [Flavobacterium sp. GT3R68]
MFKFFASFTFIEGITITIALIAILISLISLFNDNKKNRRELRISKLEEMLEINLYFLTYYQYLIDIVEKREKIFENGKKGIDILVDEVTADQDATEFLEIVGKTNFDRNLMRFNVLANSYLPNGELKLKCLSLVELIANLYNYSVYKVYEVRKTHPKFPLRKVYFDYIEEVEKELISEMKLGYESSKDIKRIEYYQTFKKELNI